MLKKFFTLVLFSNLFFASLVQAADRFNPINNQLTISQVIVGDTVYTDVVITVASVISVNGGVPVNNFDTFNAQNNQLSIPLVYVGDVEYTNVVINVGEILQVGGFMLSPTVSIISSSSNILQGESFTVTWRSTNASACTASGAWSGTLPIEGSRTISASNLGSINYAIYCGSGNIQRTASTTVNISSKPFFVEVPDAFPDLKKYISDLNGSAFPTNVVAIDLNKDGLLDIVIHLWHRPSTAELLSKLTENTPVPNRLVALIQKKDGSFEDQTAKIFGSDLVDLGGVSTRKVRVVDLNGDGYSDLIFATNKEDGRSYMDGKAWTAYSVAVMSNGNGTYRVEQFGLKNYHHSVEIIKNPRGSFDVLVGEREPGYSYINGLFTPLNQFKFNDSGTVLAIQTDASNFTNQILTTSVTNTSDNLGYFGYLTLYSSTDYTSWSETATFKLDSARSIKFGDSINNSYYNTIYSYQGKEFLDNGYAGFFESCSLKLYPNQDPLMVVHWTPLALSGGSGGRTFINSNETSTYSKILTLKKEGNKLVDTSAVEKSENSENANFIGCLDLNGDGYQDIVEYPYRAGAKPIVHLNNKSGKLIKLDESTFPLGPNSNQWTSLFANLRGNGLQDLIYFPGNGCQSFDSSCTQFKLWRAVKKLE